MTNGPLARPSERLSAQQGTSAPTHSGQQCRPSADKWWSRTGQYRFHDHFRDSPLLVMAIFGS
jgi:hypothetical protein